MKNSHKTLDFTPLEKAIRSLDAAFMRPPQNDLERDGTIQRFEFTFELCWKSIRKLLHGFGKTEVSASPKPIFRDALEENLISDIQLWFEFLEARNNIAHVYNEKQAQQVFEVAKRFLPCAKNLLAELQKRQHLEP